MALTKSTLASASYIVPTVGTTLTFTAANQAGVTGVQPNQFSTALSSATTISTSAVGLFVPVRITNPGIFTAGTAQEGTLSNPTNDSNN